MMTRLQNEAVSMVVEEDAKLTELHSGAGCLGDYRED
jgi:hypothetical protein